MAAWLAGWLFHSIRRRRVQLSPAADRAGRVLVLYL